MAHSLHYVKNMTSSTKLEIYICIALPSEEDETRTHTEFGEILTVIFEIFELTDK